MSAGLHFESQRFVIANDRLIRHAVTLAIFRLQREVETAKFLGISEIALWGGSDF
jgi:hypothetical protein